MILRDFTGGLNIRQAPYLIKSNESLVLTNVDITNETLKPIKELKIYKDDKEYKPYIYEWKDTILDSDNYRTYLEYKNLLLWSEETQKAMKFDGANTYTLGIENNSDKATLSEGDSGNLNGTYSYRYTYYNSNDGTESVPTDISDELEVTDKQIVISNIVKSNNPQVNKIRLYRIGGNITTYSLVTELDNENQTYTDNIADIDIDGRILDSYNNYPPVEGIKQLCYHLGYFLGFKDDTMYWSEIGNPNYWSKFNYISFEEEVRGIGLLQGAILVFLPNKTYIIQGTDPSVFVKYLLSNEQGCVSYKSINYASNKIVWASNDGLCTTNGGEILVVSKEKLGKIGIKDVVNSAVLDETYYLLHKDGILVGDGRFGIRFSYYQLDNIANIQQVKTNDTILLYNKEDKHIYKFNGDNYLTMEYLSPKLIDTSYTLSKWFQDIYIKYEGKIGITFYIDDKEVLVIDELKTDNVKLPASKQRGKSISFKVMGTGSIEEIEFKYKGRENGK